MAFEAMEEALGAEMDRSMKQTGYRLPTPRATLGQPPAKLNAPQRLRGTMDDATALAGRVCALRDRLLGGRPGTDDSAVLHTGVGGSIGMLLDHSIATNDAIGSAMAALDEIDREFGHD